MRVLTLDKTGMPRDWVTMEKAVEYYAKDMVSWTAGSPIKLFRGGINRESGLQSRIEPNSIIAIKTKGFDVAKHGKVHLTNATLFGRDRFTCAYCGHSKSGVHLSRDHIIPTSRGGENKWMNVVTACIDCNTHKDNRTPQEARMDLLYLPYVPSYHEYLILQNRNVLADQMEFLKVGVPKYSRVI